jgi:hypothetical protein
MRKASVAVVVISGISLLAPCAPIRAEQMPKSGTFTVHTGWKSIGETAPAAANRTYGSGNFWGVIFNDKGSGPLHLGPALCPYTFEIVDGTMSARGQCSWGDADGDKIFTDWTGTLPPSNQFSGMNQITGGTGKFTGIQGRVPFQCKPVSANGQWVCTQQFEYRLP